MTNDDDDDEMARSSLLRIRHHSAQREHSKKQHQRLHRALKKKQDDVGDDGAVTEVVATISIIQQINVDSNGNTIGIETIQTHLSAANITPPAIVTEAPQPTNPVVPEVVPSPAPPPPSPVEPFESPPVPTEPAPSPPLPTQTLPTDSLPAESSPLPPVVAASAPLIPADTSANITLSITDAPAIATSSLSPITTFPPLTASLNSTSIFSILNNKTQTYSNSSRLSSSLSSSRSSSLLSLSDTTTSLFASSVVVPRPTDGLVAAGTNVAPAGTPDSTANSSSDNNDDSGLPPTPVVVGGVIGSIAGAAVLIIAMLFIIRWRKRNKGMLSLRSESAIGDGRGISDEPGPGDMMERRSAGFTIPASFANIANKRFSRNNDATDTPAQPAERGFYRISGRKLPSVLQNGGDGYGGGSVIDNDTSFYRDSHAFFGGRGPPSPPLGTINRKSTGGIPIFRPSPARTPTREESPFNFSAEDVPSPPRIPDHVGRSHASQDGSHPSRFTEEV